MASKYELHAEAADLHNFRLMGNSFAFLTQRLVQAEVENFAAFLFFRLFHNPFFLHCLFLISHSFQGRTVRVKHIVIVNSVFLQRPQKRSRGNQLIHRRLSKTKTIGSSSDPESQASRQSDGYGGWCLELRQGGR